MSGYILDLTPQLTGTATFFSIDPQLSTGSKINQFNGYLELTAGCEGQDYTVIAGNGFNNMNYTFSILYGTVAEDPVRFLSLGYYDEYEFAVNYPVNLPLFITGPVISCKMSGDEIPGLSFGVTGLKGTPESSNLTVHTMEFTCRNDVSTSNKFIVKAMVHASGKPGLIGNYWKWKRYTPAFPCNVKTNAFYTAGASLEVRRIDTNFAITNDNYFNFYKDFTSYYGVTWTGYINVPTAKEYIFYADTSSGSYIEIDEETVVDNMLKCDNSPEKIGDPVFLTAGYHRIVMGFRRKDKTAYALFSWNKLGPKTAITSSDLSYVPLSAVSYATPINCYLRNSEVSNALEVYDVTVSSCEVFPKTLPAGLSVSATGVLSGKPTSVTTFADYVYSLKCTASGKEIEHQFSIEVRDFDLLPEIPYIMLKRAVDRRVPVSPDMYFQEGWTVDNSCYPNEGNLYFRVEKDIETTTPGTVSCSGSQKYITCNIRLNSGTSGNINYDSGPDYDRAFQISIVARGLFDTSRFLLIVAINGDRNRQSVLKISFTHTSSTPIPGWVYFGIWTVSVQNDGMPEAPPGSNPRCPRFTLYDRNMQPLLEIYEGYTTWLSKQGLLLEPNYYTLMMTTVNDRWQCVDIGNGAWFNVTIENTYTVYHLDFLEVKNLNFRIQRMECASSEAENLPLTQLGGFVEFPCPAGQVGIMIRRCKLDVSGLPVWASIESTCRDYYPIATFHYGIEEINIPTNTSFVLTPTIEGDHDQFEISPVSSADFTFNSQTGEIKLFSLQGVSEYQT